MSVKQLKKKDAYINGLGQDGYERLLRPNWPLGCAIEDVKTINRIPATIKIIKYRNDQLPRLAYRMKNPLNSYPLNIGNING